MTKLCSAHWRSWVERCDHARIDSPATPATSAIPVCGSIGPHSRPTDSVQFAPQRGLVNDARSLGLMMQRLRVDRTPLRRRRAPAYSAKGRGCVGADPRPVRSHAGRPQPPNQAAARGLFYPSPGCARGCIRHGNAGTATLRATAVLWASTTALDSTSSPPRARSSDTLFGAENVRSKPCVERALYARPLAPLGAIPSSSQRATTSMSASPPARSAALKPTSAAAFSASPAHTHTGARVSPSE